jgi:tripartite-type tricarboxylate transporter receptor subunit TctC
MAQASTMTRRAFATGLSALGLCAASSALAEPEDAYPRKTIRIVVPYPAGGATDTLARLMATKLQESWGQAVVVENKPGASGTIGNDMVAKSPPDGHTVLLAITAIVQVPALMPNLGYDVMKDLQPLAQVATTNSILAVPKSAPVSTLKEFVELARANPGKYNFGSYGVGTSSHIQGALLNLQAKLDLAHVPYKGAAPLLQDLRGGQLFSAFIDMATARPHLDAMKPLAVTGPRRNPLLPDVPTFAELGYQSFEPLGWFALFMPAGVPAPIARQFAGEANRILLQPDVKQRIEGLGMTPGGIPTADFARIVRDDAAIYTRIIRDANIRLE